MGAIGSKKTATQGELCGTKAVAAIDTCLINICKSRTLSLKFQMPSLYESKKKIPATH